MKDKQIVNTIDFGEVMDIKPVKQKTVTFQIMEQLKQLIVDGTLKPGDKMPNEYELADMFGVGRSTIREVLKIFQYMGVVELRNPKGTFICESSNISSEALEWSMLLGHKDFSEIIEMRIVMEQQGLWYLLDYRRDDKNLKEATIKKLQLEIEKMNAAVNRNDIEGRLNADYSFHGHIIEVCENSIFNNLYRTMKNFMVKEIADSQKDMEQLMAIPQRHEMLINALIEGDYTRAAETYRHHIRNIDQLLEEKIGKQ
ncbi:MAG: FadR family transcriptional regulator [Spirochaetales bacterium]|nr:FadR family transcriptional regulator [Spirochaetales bacterium]